MDLNDLEVLKSDFENFDLYSNIEEEYSIRPRGGILVLVKKHLVSAVKPKTKNELIVAIEIQGHILKNQENICLIAVYIPPQGSAYSKENHFDILEDSISEIRENCEKIILVGDLNSKTKQADDFLILNEHDHFDQLDGIFDNHTCLKKGSARICMKLILLELSF